MSTHTNQEVLFTKRPNGNENNMTECFQVNNVDMPTKDMLNENEVVVASYLFSVDPTMRNAMVGSTLGLTEKENTNTYYQMMNWKTNNPGSGRIIGYILHSKDANFKVGDCVSTRGYWRRFNVFKSSKVQKLDTSIPVESYMSVLGGTGNASYLPIKHIGKPKEGEVAFVSGAAGATGFCAVQVLKLLGCTVIGCASTPEKIQLLESIGVHAFNYKMEKPLDALLRLAPNGLDIYFDNVGGEILESALEVMNDFGRIIACGSISGYDQPVEKRYGVRNLFHIVAKRLTFQGYITDPLSFTMEQFADANQQLSKWLMEKKIIDQYTIVDGFDQLPNALYGLFESKNTGKMMVRCQLPIELGVNNSSKL